MDLVDVVLVAGGLIVLVVGGELLVRGASGLAARLGLSRLVIGLTVVALATSAPELAVTIDAVLGAQPDLAIGNVVGSNIAMVLLILGASAIVAPLAIGAQLVRLDIPLLVGASVLLLVLSFDGSVSVVDGTVLLAVAAGYMSVVLVLGRTQGARFDGEDRPEQGDRGDVPGRSSTLGRQLVAVAAGVVLLVLGARLLVTGAVGIATGLGISSLVVGLTVVAVGTSLPELATSLIAAVRGERDLAVGNIVGSCVFNICVAVGAAALVAKGGIPVAPAAVALDIPLMIAAAVALLPVAFTGLTVARWEGVLFVALYVAYTAYVLLAATDHDALEDFTVVMVSFTLPLVALTLIVLVSYEVGRRRGSGRPVPPR